MRSDPVGTGVYAIRCVIDGKVYVGSAAVSLKQRWRSHRKELRRGTHCNRHLRFAWAKHSEAAFEFTVIEECEPGECLTREQYWIDRIGATNPLVGYNISPTAGSPLGVRHTAEVRAKVSAAQRGRKYGPDFRKAVSDGLRGKKREPFSEEWRRALSESKKGRPQSEEHRRKLSDANRRRWAARRQMLGIGDKPPSCIGTSSVCVACGDLFVKKTSQVKVCGVDCRKDMERRRELGRCKNYATIKCVTCGSDFKPSRSVVVACSPECQAERERRRKRVQRTA